MPSEYAAEQLQALTGRLEQGITDLFASGRYADYLQTMSKFHQYSFGNVLLILMQCPHASQAAGFNTWKKDFGRSVKRGEKGIKILAPCPYKMFEERDKLDAATHRPVLDDSGKPVKETVLMQKARFRVASVFDVSQTEGKELPALAVSELTGDVANYDTLMEKLIELAPVPVAFEPISGTAKGCFNRLEQCIVVRPA